LQELWCRRASFWALEFYLLQWSDLGTNVLALLWHCLKGTVLGLATTGLIFTGIPEGAQPGGGG